MPSRACPDPANADVTHSLSVQGKDVVFRTDTPSGDLEAFVDFVVGSGDRGMTFVGHDSEGGWHELRMTYYGSIAAWDRTPGHQVQPHSAQEFLGVPQSPDMLRRCLGCHTTRGRINPDGNGIMTVGARGFDCERCHGPAGNHLAAIDASFVEPAIGRPRLASAAVVNTLCGQCHSADGRGITPDNPNMARFQVSSLALSRCATTGREAMSCLTCHSPHRDAETSPAYYEAKCLECHSPVPVPPAVASAVAGSTRDAATTTTTARTVCPVNPTRGCISCHMRKVETDVPHAVFTDHRIH